ncbi:serine hydrolase [Aminipila butyrica]|uniref:Serine hydrolase n=1 Tax=Aminipila butyrica TaxID=433296 RepID=A0A858C0N9_9FIRM|nr:serine hydrolase [Aminipila butyrica]
MFHSASIIKLPIYVEIMRRYSLGQLDLKQRVQVCKEDILPSCGAINLFLSVPFWTLEHYAIL